MSAVPDPTLVELLAQMDGMLASDLFLAEGKPPAIRVHGTVRTLDLAPTRAEALDELVSLATTPKMRERFERDGDLDVGLSLAPGDRYRLNISRQQGKVGIVARSVPSGELSLAQLGLPEEIGRFAEEQRGLVLVTGATGSGKSTTLAALINRINERRAVHIVTIEDPIEYVHRDKKSLITQREVGGDTADFSSALKHVVRQSPDVILIGEMRDAETMQVAMAAALTGHLVFATLHTIDATQTLQRMLSYFPEHLRQQTAMDLSMALLGIISQRLLPRADHRGRVVAAEILSNSPGVAKLLRDQRVEELEDLMKTSKLDGIVSFNQALLQLFRAKTIDYDVGLAYASNPDEFALEAKGMATGQATFAPVLGEGEFELDMKALLNLTLERGASDLHLTSGRPPILRITGGLVPVSERQLSDADMRVLLFSILSGRQRSIFELEREIDFALALDGGRRFRVNAYYQKGKMAAALRAIPPEVPDPAELRVPATLLRLGMRPHGLLLVVGPTGAGKSTTLACLVDQINRNRACRILTIEDPIEYTHDSKVATVDQREVHADTRSFAAALKYILRQDPDVILVGEMRDHETVSAALTAAETGHLVLATLHSNDAIQAVDRIIDVFPSHQQNQARSQLAASLLAIVSQRLLPRMDGSGRVAAFEILVGTSAIKAVIRDDKLHQAASLMETARQDGMVTLDAALKELYQEELISRDEALRYIKNPRSIPAPPAAPTGLEDRPPPTEGSDRGGVFGKLGKFRR